MRWSVSALTSTLARRMEQEFGRLSEAERTFMTRICARDLLNYVKVEKGFLYGEQPPDEAALRYLEFLMEERPTAYVLLVDEWFPVWALKWRQRVKLASEREFDEKLVERIERAAQPFVNLPLYEEARKFALGSLIKSGEVCFTDSLSEMVVKNILYSMVMRASGAEEVRGALERNPLLLLNEITKRVRALARFGGPLVALRFEKIIFGGEAWSLY